MPRTPLDELFFEISVRQQEVERQLKRVQAGLRQTDRTTRDLDASARRATKSASGMASSFKRLAGAVGGLFLLREATRSVVDFDRAIREIATIAPGGTEQVNRLREATLELSRTVPQSASELGAGAYQILSAGISDTADVLAVLEASSRAAVAGLTNTETAVDATTTVINAFRLRASEAERVSDVLFKTVELGKLRFDDIAQNIGQAATSAALAGISFEELSAAAAVMTQRGINAAEAYTSLNRLALTLVQQTNEQRAAFERLGISFDTATVAEKGFAGLLEEINKLTEGQVDQLAELFPNIRAARSAFILAGSATDDYRKTLDKLTDSQGAATRAFDENIGSIENQYKLLKNQLNVILLEIAEDTLPLVITVFKGWGLAIGEVTDALASHAKRLRQAIGEVQDDIDGIVRQAEQLGTERFTLRVIIGPELIAADREVRRLRKEVEELSDPGFFASVAAGLRGGVAAGVARSEILRELAAAEARLKALTDAAKRLAGTPADTGPGRTGETAAAREARRKAEEEAAKARTKAAEEAAKERLKIEEELARRVSEITLSAAEQEIEAVRQLRQAYIDAGGEISDAMEESFAIVGAAAEEALRREKAEKLADDFKRAIEEGLAQIELQSLGIADEEARTAFVIQKQQDLFAGLLDQAHARLEASETTTEEEKKLRDIIKEIVKLLGQAKGEQEDLAEKARRDAEERLQNLTRTVQLVQQAADGAIDLARAFGLVNEETEQTLDNLAQIAASAAQLVGSIQAGPAGIPGVIASALSLLGGIAGLIGGDDPLRQEQRRIAEENRRALEELTLAVDRLRGSFDITGSDFARAQQALAGLDFKGFGGFGDIVDLVKRLQALGLSMEELERIAAEFGITLRDSAGNILPSALRDLQAALDEVADDLIGFPDTISGELQELQFLFDQLDVSGPLEQLQLLQKQLIALAKTGEGVPALQKLLGLDLTTAEGRAAAEAEIERLSRLFAAGQLRPEDIGAATSDEAEALLRLIESLLDDIAEGQGDVTGETQDVRRAIHLTEIQGNQILSFMSQGLFLDEMRNRFQEQQLALLEQVVAILQGQGLPPPILPPPAPATAAAGVGGVAAGAGAFGGTGGILVQVHIDEINVGAGASRTQAVEVTDALVERLNRELGRKLNDALRLIGS